jgi:hypothetical protein
MKKIHAQSPKKRITIGLPFETAIEKYLLPKTNNGNLSHAWNYTDWARYSLAQQIAKHNKGMIPKECKDMLPEFIPDIDL